MGGGDWTMAGHIAMGYARSPAGPWSPPRIILRNDLNPAQNRSDWDCHVTNPSAVLLPNGTVMLVFSSVPCTGGFEEALGVASWTRATKPPHHPNMGAPWPHSLGHTRARTSTRGPRRGCGRANNPGSAAVDL